MPNDAYKPSDAEIVSQVLDGNVNAFESLFTRYKALVLGIVRKHAPSAEVDDIAQEVFVRAYQSLPTFKGKGHFSRWLSSIAVRACYDFWRRKYRSREVPLSTFTEEHQKWLEGVTSRESEQAMKAEGSRRAARELLDWALGRLSAEDRMVLELVYLEELSVKEAADLLGWSTA
ncbi:MAG: RNA polymerase sigma factor, partial [Pseudomonadota bacterium]